MVTRLWAALRRLGRAAWPDEVHETGRGLRFGSYRVVEQLGVGSTAVVFGAVHDVTGAPVAIKVLPAGWGASPELRARLDREAALLRRIDHPNVIRVHAVGPVAPALGGGCYLALEHLPTTLARLLDGRRSAGLLPEAAVRLAQGVAAGLAAIHGASLLHRDIKPSNILLRADGTPVLADFGLATLLAGAAADGHLTPSNVILGTADYLSPEQVAGRPLDERSDLYALGVVLYELLAGWPPFAGRAPLATLRAHLSEPPPPLPATVPEAARAVVARCLRKRPTERYASAAELVAALDAAVWTRPVAWAR